MQGARGVLPGTARRLPTLFFFAFLCLRVLLCFSKVIIIREFFTGALFRSNEATGLHPGECQDHRCWGDLSHLDEKGQSLRWQQLSSSVWRSHVTTHGRSCQEQEISKQKYPAEGVQVGQCSGHLAFTPLPLSSVPSVCARCPPISCLQRVYTNSALSEFV